MVMWRLTIVTIVMEIPNIIFAFYGINTVDLPLPYTWFAILLAVCLTLIAAVILVKWKKK